MRTFVIGAAVAALAGCAGTPPAAPDASATRAPMAQPPSTAEQTVSVMLERARSARLAGQLADAESTLESALRIAPGDARLWLELAEVQFASGEFDAAQTLAERALSLSGGDASVIEAAQRLSAQLGE